MTKISKIERLLTLMDVLVSTGRPLVLAEIAARVPGYPSNPESFRRTFERDKADLRAMGVPLEMEDVYESEIALPGYRIHPREYALKDPGLDAEELEALRLATAVVGTGPGSRSALFKLGAGDRPSRPDVEIPADPGLSTIFGAIGERRRVIFRYRDLERTVEPHRIELRNGRWYLRGFDLVRGDIRWYRLDRVDGAIGVDGPAGAFDRPAGGVELRSDPWAISEADEPVHVTVRFDPEIAPAVRAELGDAEMIADGAAGLDARILVTDREGFRSWILSFLDRVEVIDPPEVRAELIAHLEVLVGGR